jgi:2-polyprenyl-6-hydroxyphenyl methylase/3-demethylubiquinone-9 3-methyltransferase
MATETSTISGYNYYAEGLDPSHDYLLPTVLRLLGAPPTHNPRMFDLGCGNGSVGAQCAARGWKVSGVDPSTDGIADANARRPELDLHTGSAYDDLRARFGQFSRVLSLEVVEHVYAPRDWARTLFDLTAPGGRAIVSTPYHGYLKNLAISLTGGWDPHFSALWDHGHIKFWSRATLTNLLVEAGFDIVEFARVGRIPVLAKSMILVGQRPA